MRSPISPPPARKARGSAPAAGLSVCTMPSLHEGRGGPARWRCGVRRQAAPARASPSLEKGEHSVEPLVVQPGDQPESIGPLEKAAAYRFGDLLRQEQQFILVRVELRGKPADEAGARVFTKGELAVLDLADVGV